MKPIKFVKYNQIFLKPMILQKIVNLIFADLELSVVGCSWKTVYFVLAWTAEVSVLTLLQHLWQADRQHRPLWQATLFQRFSVAHCQHQFLLLLKDLRWKFLVVNGKHWRPEAGNITLLKVSVKQNELNKLLLILSPRTDFFKYYVFFS